MFNVHDVRNISENALASETKEDRIKLVPLQQFIIIAGILLCTAISIIDAIKIFSN